MGDGYLEDEFISGAELIPEAGLFAYDSNLYALRPGLKEGKPDYGGFPKATQGIEIYFVEVCRSIRKGCLSIA